MTIEKKNENGKLTLTIIGKINTTTSPELQTTLIPTFDEAKEVILDFAGVDYISSAGLRVLFTGNESAKAAGGKMTLRNVKDDIREIFDITGFSAFLVIE